MGGAIQLEGKAIMKRTLTDVTSMAFFTSSVDKILLHKMDSVSLSNQKFFYISEKILSHVHCKFTLFTPKFILSPSLRSLLDPPFLTHELIGKITRNSITDML